MKGVIPVLQQDLLVAEAAEMVFYHYRSKGNRKLRPDRSWFVFACLSPVTICNIAL